MRSIYTSQVIDQNVVLESIALENISLGYSHHVLPLCINLYMKRRLSVTNLRLENSFADLFD